MEERARSSRFLNDPHVRRLMELAQDRGLFEKSPDYLARLRRDLLRSSLEFFARNSEFYERLFSTLGIDRRRTRLRILRNWPYHPTC